MIKVLMISTDSKILEQGSSVRLRMIGYGSLFSELHIIVFGLKTTSDRVTIADNVYVYGTQSYAKVFYIKDAVRKGKEILKTFAVGESVITTQDPFETGIVGYMLSKKFGIPLHVQIHTDFNSRYFKKGILNTIRVVFSKIVLPHAHAIRAVSERIKSTLPYTKTAVLPLFVDVGGIKNFQVTIDLKKKYPQFTKIVLIASRLTQEKDVTLALKAFIKILPSHPMIGLVIVGEGPERISLERLITKERDSVFFESWADHTTVISYMKTCDVFVSSSLYEGYGLSMLEAHTAGAILVATDAGIAPLLVSKENLIEPGDVGRMSEVLTQALAGNIVNKSYQYPYTSKQEYLDMYKKDIERAV